MDSVYSAQLFVSVLHKLANPSPQPKYFAQLQAVTVLRFT
jgi:hypothetical protein